MRTDVVALYVDPRGPYPKLDVVCYVAPAGQLGLWCPGDATQYRGPAPVVAHPPCGPWGRLRHLSRKDAPELAIRAVEQVRAFGGVLEHPAGSLLWKACGMPKPGAPPDRWGGFTIEVSQCDWGHPARKMTWLYLVGVNAFPPLPPHREPTHWISGGRNPLRKNGKRGGGVVPPGTKVCSAQQRRRTPPAFADWLLEIAAGARRLEIAS